MRRRPACVNLHFDYSGNMEEKQAIRALSALAQETRLAIFRFLVGCGPEGAAAGAVGEAMQLAPATLSFHLKELREAGWVRRRTVGRQRIYSPQWSRAEELIGFLGENCCRGRAKT